MPRTSEGELWSDDQVCSEEIMINVEVYDPCLTSKIELRDVGFWDDEDNRILFSGDAG
jgi:hypothetical protein